MQTTINFLRKRQLIVIQKGQTRGTTNTDGKRGQVSSEAQQQKQWIVPHYVGGVHVDTTAFWVADVGIC